MAASLINGLIASGHSTQQIWVADVDTEKLQSLSSNLGICVAADNEQLVNEADVVVLAVKPQVLRDVALNISGCVQKNNSLVVSIAAGVNQKSLALWLDGKTAIVRCMPNTPALVLTGATALHANEHVSAEQRDLAENILRAVGLAIWVDDEAELDTVTAVSGSGPAYFFLLMEAMEKTAVDLGLTAETAELLVQQTALGAAKIALESAESAEQLRKRVTSPGGTTQAALESFHQDGFSAMVAKALHAARDRSITMSIQMGEEK